MRIAIVNLGCIVTGDWREPFAQGEAILAEDGKITKVGGVSDADLAACDVVIDADGATAIPGLIDSQVHNTFGDYTPRQKTVGFLESYVHGGVTTAISASEVPEPANESRMREFLFVEIFIILSINFVGFGVVKSVSC